MHPWARTPINRLFVTVSCAVAGRGSAGGAPKGPGPDVALFTVYEWCGVAVIALYAVVYLYGRGENDKIKTAWYGPW